MFLFLSFLCIKIRAVKLFNEWFIFSLLNNSLNNINEQLIIVARYGNLDAFVGTNADYFIIHGSNTPSGTEGHGFLFCKYYNGSYFAPNGNGAEPITKQVYMPYNNNSMFIRTYNHNTKIWTAWTEH